MRRHRRRLFLQGKWPVILDDLEAAEFLGIPVRQVRKLAEDGTLTLFQNGRVFDVEDLHAFLLSKASNPAEERAVTIRRARFEARDLENYPDQLRLEVIDDFIATWERFATRLVELQHDEEAGAVRRILEQVRKRHGEVADVN